MSYLGYPDLAAPVDVGGEPVYRPYGGGPFVLLPSWCAMADLDDGRVDFRLELIRSATPSGPSTASGPSGYAGLELRLDARYATERALAGLRGRYPHAVLAGCPLTDWTFRLERGAATADLPEELLSPVGLASNGLGSARLVLRLTVDSGLKLDTMIRQEWGTLDVLAEAGFAGVSPRVPAVVRFQVAALRSALDGVLAADASTTWDALAGFLGVHHAELPLDVSGTVDAAFGAALADRLVGRFGGYLSGNGAGPRVTLAGMGDGPGDGAGDTELTWSLSQPHLAQRRLTLRFDLLADLRERIRRLGIDAFVTWRTATDLPDLGRPVITVLSTLPAERVGLAALGATLTFPADPPLRPHAKTVTVALEPPADLAVVDVKLAPGERPCFEYTTYAVVADEHGVRTVEGVPASQVGSPLRLVPDAFPVTMVMVEATPALLELATIAGVCRYQLGGGEHAVPFTVDSGRLAVAVAVPRDAEAVTVLGTATARHGGATVPVGPFESRHVRLDLTSFPQYGWHEVEFRCDFDGRHSVYAIDVLPADRDESDGDVSVLAFTPAHPARTFGWFTGSPFAPGLRYRTHRDGGGPGGWRDIPAPAGQVVVTPERAVPVARVAEVAEAGPLDWPAGAPLSPDQTVSDQLLFRDMRDSQIRYYLPRYRMAVQTVSGQQRYRIAMSPEAGAWALTVHLVAVAADNPPADWDLAAVYPHDLAASLSFLPAPPSGARKVLAFEEMTRDSGGATLRLPFATLEERDEVYRALTEPAREASLVVHRTIRVNVPIPPKPVVPDTRPRPWPPDDGGPLRPGLDQFPIMWQPDLLIPKPTYPKRPIPDVYRPTRPDKLIAPNLLVLHRFPETAAVTGLPKPVLAFESREARDVGGVPHVEVRLGVTNWAAFSPDFFAPAPDLPPCGANQRAARTWVDVHDADTGARLYGFGNLISPADLASLRVFIPASRPVPARVHVRLTDRRSTVVSTSNAVATSTSEAGAAGPRTSGSIPSVQEVTKDLEQVVAPAPFMFLPSLHGYVFQGVTPGGGAGGYVRHQIQGAGRFHTYLQDATRPHVVHYFPDEFKIARRPEPPHTPWVTVRVVSASGRADTQVVFHYIVAPYTDPDRLRQARDRLLADPRFGAADVQFQPFLTSDVSFSVDRPTTHGSVREVRTGASQVLQSALKDTLVMGLEDFGVLFDALHRDTASLFMGSVRIEVPGGAAELIPFRARLDDLVGAVFTAQVAATADGSLAVTLTNAVESPLRVNTLDAAVASAPAAIRGLTLPVERLAPGGRLDLDVVPSTPLSGPPEVSFRLDGVKVLADAEAIWNAILDRATVEYFDIVTVKALPVMFEPLPDRPNDRIEAILVEFEGGATAQLDAGTLEARVRVDYPIDDVILRRRVDTSYRYTVTVIRADGRQDRDPQPRQHTARLFFVSVVR
jgi:hypothetical protein